MTIEKYLESKKFAWSETTLRSERHRLNGVAGAIDGNPETLWAALQSHKPYSRLTVWTRVTQYWQFLIDTGIKSGLNPYHKWRKTNARLFKNCYQKTKPETSFAEAKALISTIEDVAIRERANFILDNGLRISESSSVDGSGSVVGKGNKPRHIYGNVGATGGNGVSDGRVRRSLARLGLKPHDLRKIFLSRLVELGANEFELCEIAGWSSIATASSYIKVSDKRLSDLVRRASE